MESCESLHIDWKKEVIDQNVREFVINTSDSILKTGYDVLVTIVHNDIIGQIIAMLG